MIMTQPKFKFFTKLKLQTKQQGWKKNGHTLWSPPPVANLSPHGWTSMEKICIPSCLTQRGFSAIILQKKFLFQPKTASLNFHSVKNLRKGISPQKALWKSESSKTKKNQAIILISLHQKKMILGIFWEKEIKSDKDKEASFRANKQNPYKIMTILTKIEGLTSS